MNIKTSKELQESIDLAISGNTDILYDIARYIAYNYYMYTHVKEGSETDVQNDVIYKDFQKKHPKLLKEVEQIIDSIYEKL